MLFVDGPNMEKLSFLRPNHFSFIYLKTYSVIQLKFLLFTLNLRTSCVILELSVNFINNLSILLSLVFNQNIKCKFDTFLTCVAGYPFMGRSLSITYLVHSYKFCLGSKSYILASFSSIFQGLYSTQLCKYWRARSGPPTVFCPTLD